MPLLRDNGLIHLSSSHTVVETLARLEAIVQAKGLTILARIDHSGDAAKAGLEMPPTKLLIFGNAKMGHSLDDRLAQRCHRPTPEGIDLAG